MYGFKEQIEDEGKELRYLIEKYQERPHNKIKGSLVCYIINDDVVYSIQSKSKDVEKQKVKSIILGKFNDKSVLKAKESRFNYETLKAMEYDLKMIERLEKKYREYRPSYIHSTLPAAYKDLPDKCYTDSRYEELQDWAAARFMQNGREFNKLANVAVDGTLVRSKGEAIIYNMLVYYGIPFRYECRLKLIDSDGAKVYRYPDFTFDTVSGRKIYWEHLGLLENEDYCQRFGDNTLLYHLNGICIGDNLILTSDRIGGTINTNTIDTMIRSYILPQVKLENA